MSRSRNTWLIHWFIHWFKLELISSVSRICSSGVTYYSVINKEGHKVLSHKTIKKCDFDAFLRFIASKNMGHFVIFVICLIITNIIFIEKYLKKCRKLAKSILFRRNFSFFGWKLRFLAYWGKQKSYFC